LLTREDIRIFPVLEQTMARGSYRGHEVASGPNIIEMLQILEQFDLRRLGHNSPEYVDLCARAQRAAFADYTQLKGLDVEAAEGVQQRLISAERARFWADRI